MVDINIDYTRRKKERFKRIWNFIYNNWDQNHWVWVVEFKVVKC